MTTRLSGMQLEVLALYRTILREAVKKDRETVLASSKAADLLSNPLTTSSYAAAEFRKQAAAAKRSDFKKIEYLIRKGEKQLKLLRMPGVKVVRGTG
jgi:succinate dehydrogenase assembly factor 1